MGCSFSSPDLHAPNDGVHSYAWDRDNTGMFKMTGSFTEIGGGLGVEGYPGNPAGTCVWEGPTVTPMITFTDYSASTTATRSCSLIVHPTTPVVECDAALTDLAGGVTIVFTDPEWSGPGLPWRLQATAFDVHSGPYPTEGTVTEYTTTVTVDGGQATETVVVTDTIHCDEEGGQQQRRRAAPTAAPEVARRNGVAGPYQQCAGKTWNGPFACQSGWICVRSDDWYSQCRPDPNPPRTTTTTTTTTTTSARPSSTVIVQPYEQCGGRTWTGPTICRAGFVCVASDASYSQCRPGPTDPGTVAAFGQCGGIGYSGTTKCTTGWECSYVNPYYSQCLLGSGTSEPSSSSTTASSTSTTKSSSSTSSTTSSSSTSPTTSSSSTLSTTSSTLSTTSSTLSTTSSTTSATTPASTTTSSHSTTSSAQPSSTPQVPGTFITTHGIADHLFSAGATVVTAVGVAATRTVYTDTLTVVETVYEYEECPQQPPDDELSRRGQRKRYMAYGSYQN